LLSLFVDFRFVVTSCAFQREFRRKTQPFPTVYYPMPLDRLADPLSHRTQQPGRHAVY